MNDLPANLKECALCLDANEHGEELFCSHPWCPNRHLWKDPTIQAFLDTSVCETGEE